MSDVVILNGEPVDAPDTSAARLLGMTCFDTIAFRDTELIRGEAHLERLAKGARTLGLGPVGGWEAVDESVEAALARTHHEEGILRVSLHARGQPVGLQLEDRLADVQVSITPPRYGDLTEGVDVVTSTIPAPGSAWPAHVKAPCLPRTIAHREARGRGAFEGLMLDRNDHVVSGTRSNVFARLEDTLVTPPSPPAFPGITRSSVLEGAKELGYPATSRPLDRAVLDEARELFLSFTGPGVVPIRTLDGDPALDPVPGSWTSRLADEVEHL